MYTNFSMVNYLKFTCDLHLFQTTYKELFKKHEKKTQICSS